MLNWYDEPAPGVALPASGMPPARDARRAARQPPRSGPDLLRYLLDRELVTVSQMLSARRQMRQDRIALADILLNQGWVDLDSLQAARADCFGLRQINLVRQPPDPALMARVDPATCLRHGFVPWQVAQTGAVLVATCRPEDFDSLGSGPLAAFDTPRMVLVSPAAVQAAVTAHWQDHMTAAATTRVPATESCRSWRLSDGRNHALLALAGLALLALVLRYPAAVFAVLAFWALATLAVAALHKTAAVAAYLLRPRAPPALPAPPTAAGIDDATAPFAQDDASPPRPTVSILAPMFREPEVADHLIRRLDALHYPKSLLDILLVLEEHDIVTRTALARVTLPPHMRIITVPDGQPRTKPRAMNYALDFCRGDIIGIYDAEDAPDPDQLDKVVARFARAPPDLVCLQGVLDYYNPRQNWLARCFTIEYATWFRVLMPGMARLGFAIPLGGTTLFFRRTALETLGGWDAHNVTEDADLGFRLARHGFRTEMIATTTHEEANCHPLPWIKQRSRWLKGYMVTYLVHMRRPALLLQQLGLWRFIGYQTHFVTALSQFLLAPVLWSFWLVVFGLPHPLNGLLSAPALTAVARLFLMVEALTIVAGLIAVRGPAHRHLMFWVPTLHFYFPLGVFAAYKALYELVFAPFYWDKTAHGHSLKPATGLLRRLFTPRS